MCKMKSFVKIYQNFRKSCYATNCRNLSFFKWKNIEKVPSKAKAQYAYYNLNTFDSIKAKNEGTIIGAFCAGFIFLGDVILVKEHKNGTISNFFRNKCTKVLKKDECECECDETPVKRDKFIESNSIKLINFKASQKLDNNNNQVLINVNAENKPYFEELPISSIVEKFEGLNELAAKGPEDAFFVVEGVLDENAIESICLCDKSYALASEFESSKKIPLKVTTEIYSSGIKELENTEVLQSCKVNEKYRYKLCNDKCSKEQLQTIWTFKDYWNNFISSLFQVSQSEKCSREPPPAKSVVGEYWNSFMLFFEGPRNEENEFKLNEFSILQTIKDESTDNTLLCTAYVYKAKDSKCQSPESYNFYKLVLSKEDDKNKKSDSDETIKTKSESEVN